MDIALGRFRPAATAAALLGLLVVTGLVAGADTTGNAGWLEVNGRLLMVGVPIAVGLYARRRPPFERFGALLVLAGMGWFFASLSESEDEVLYSIGRVSAWVVESGLVYLLLAFPSGRLTGVDRTLAGAMAAVVAVLYLPTALLVEHYPTPSPYTTCDSACPGNAFMLVGSEPAFVDDVLRPLREVLTVAILAAATVRLGWRLRHASHLLRLSVTPVLGVAILLLVATATGFIARGVAPESAFTDAINWLIALGPPALAFGFCAGVVRWRLFMAAAVERLAARLRARPRPQDMRDAFAEAFDDPELEVVFWVSEPVGHWADADGAAVALPRTPPGRCFSELVDGEQRVAGIAHDAALHADRSFIETATSYAAITLDNHRLSAQTAALLDELRWSRARIQAAADDERRRIEHDLHDGAQQRLVTLRIKLELAAERANGNGADAELLRGLGQEVEEALDEVRSLARGIYPAPLADRGLVEALRAAALRSAIPTTVLATGVGRYSRAVEEAAYFCCLEAMQNSAKHARGALASVVELSFHRGALILEIRDDGSGFDAELVAAGVGLTSMHDRLAAVGGELAIITSPGYGTRVRAKVPIVGAKEAAGTPG